MSIKILQKLSAWLKHNWQDLLFSFIIFLVTFVLTVKNHTPKTFLTGWDNLHPEFNFRLNIERSLNAAWQEYQGLGIPGGMAHAADITRQIILWALSLVLPISILRYTWAFLMLFLGPLGTYFLLRQALFKRSGLVAGFSALAASLFYIFNLATLQYFYLPYETFLSFYGFLPWLIFAALKYLDTGQKSGLTLYILVSLLATSSFYVQTMFVVYIVFLTIFCLEKIATNFKQGIKRTILLLLTTLIVNLFWLAPVAYSTFTNSKSLVNSKINSIATPETQIQNIARGNFSDIVSLKGFWWDYYDLQAPEKYDYLYSSWINHLNNPVYNKISIILFSLSFLGLLLSLLLRGKYFKWSYFGVPLFFICYFILATTNPPFGKFFGFLFTKIEILAEIFRSVFTKFSVATALIYSLGLGYFIYLLGLIRFKFFKVLSILVGLGVITSSILLTKPFFAGELISSRMRTNIPVEYMHLFKTMDAQDNNGAVAYFPTHVFWGWYFNDWGYNGSGFLWYGIKQPMLARTFDVWSQYNETFYNEVYKAVYDNDKETFKKVTDKYNVSYLLLDYSELNPGGGGEKVLYLERIESLIKEDNNFQKIFEEDKLKVYKINKQAKSFVVSPQNLEKISINTDYSVVDPAFSEYGNYLNTEGGIVFPFANLGKDSKVKINVSEDHVTLTSEPISNLSEAGIYMPAGEGSLDWVNILPSNRLEIKIPITEWVVEDFKENRGYFDAKNCDVKGKGEVEKSYLENSDVKRSLLLSASNGGVSCDYIYFPTVKYNQGYLVRIEGENLRGRGLKIYLYNVASGRLDLEEILAFAKPYNTENVTSKFDSKFLLYPKTINEEKGYTLTFETRSFGKVASENTISKVSFIALPTNWLNAIKIIPQRYSDIENDIVIKEVREIGTAIYKVKTSNSGIIELAQGYSKGWLGISVQNLKLTKLEHLKINSWANGFKVPGGGTVYLFFWPQFLEWGGLFVLVLTLVSLIVKSRK